MSFGTQSSQLFDFGTYVKRQFNLLRRAKKLPEQKLESLAREAIKRLAAQDEKLELEDPGSSEEELTHLCEALMSDDETAAAMLILELNAKHISPEVIYLKYLAAAARTLGDWWEEDRVGFWQVTVATGRLLAIMRSMRHLFEPVQSRNEKAAIFASVPGEQHVLGVHMAADVFRKDNWDIAMLTGLTHDELVAEIEQNRTDVIGLSMTSSQSLDALAKLVVAIHICRPNTPVVVCGHHIKDIRPKLAWMEFDGIAEDVEEAKTVMTELVDDRSKSAAAHRASNVIRIA